MELAQIIARSLDSAGEAGAVGDQATTAGGGLMFEMALEEWREKWLERVTWGQVDGSLHVHICIGLARIEFTFCFT